MKPEAKEVSPRKVLAEVAAAVAADVHPNIIIIGSFIISQNILNFLIFIVFVSTFRAHF